MEKVERIKELTKELNKASYAYYAKDNPIMSDKQYDDLYDELSVLENETGIILATSPTQKVQGYIVDSLKEVKHTKPMLSADKTKDIEVIKKFIKKHPTIMSWKEDGLTVVLRYKNGIFQQAITRGGGTSGEDITHTMRMCKNIPVKLPYCTDLEVRGECVISWKEFERINTGLLKPYMHPRNLAAGTVRQLDPSILNDREVTFKAFELVQDELYNESKSDDTLLDHLMNISDSFDYLSDCGFDVVEHDFVTVENVEEFIEKYNPENYEYPVDGLIFEYDDYVYGKNIGTTAKFPLNMLALKWGDDLYETTLTDIEWDTSKTGLINPVAVFEPTDLGGAITTKATLHNVSYIKNLQLGVGDKIQIYRANMVIPKVHENLTRSDTYQIPTHCPVCGEPTEIKKDNDTQVLMCTNPYCKGKLLGRLSHFVSKKGMNIDGLSEETLKKFIDLGWLNNIFDIYNLHVHFDELSKMDGFGARSVKKLQDAIEKSKTVDLQHFIAALSIPNIGTSQSKELLKRFKTWEEFEKAGFGSYNFANIEGFGSVLNKNIHTWFNTMWNEDKIGKLVEIITFVTDGNPIKSDKLNGKTFVITGSLTHYPNRDALKSAIDSMGGKVSGTVSKNTFALINNNVNSTSSKNKKAKDLGVQIITEEQFIELVK